MWLNNAVMCPNDAGRIAKSVDWLNNAVMCPNDAGRMAKSVDPYQTAL